MCTLFDCVWPCVDAYAVCGDRRCVSCRHSVVHQTRLQALCFVCHSYQLRAALIRRCDRCFSELVVKTFAILEKYSVYSGRQVKEEERYVFGRIWLTAAWKSFVPG